MMSNTYVGILSIIYKYQNMLWGLTRLPLNNLLYKILIYSCVIRTLVVDWEKRKKKCVVYNAHYIINILESKVIFKYISTETSALILNSSINKFPFSLLHILSYYSSNHKITVFLIYTLLIFLIEQWLEFCFKMFIDTVN